MLALLTERPMHGYEMISELARRTTGTWRPSPGSVYPILQSLEDEGLVTAESDDGRRSYSLTETGREQATAPGTPSPWEEFETPIDPADTLLRETTAHLMGAVNQVLLSGTPAQKACATETLAQTRRTLYATLADDS
jgi:DNA-binding PadR family transcriptional regulator